MMTTIVMIKRPGDISLEDWTKFVEWHRDNPKVWEYFEKYSLELIHSGVTQCGSITILGRVRYECVIEQTGEFKVNNNYAPIYSRVFVQKYPQHKNFFVFREVK